MLSLDRLFLPIGKPDTRTKIELHQCKISRLEAFHYPSTMHPRCATEIKEPRIVGRINDVICRQ